MICDIDKIQNGGHCQPLLYSSPPEVSAFELRNYYTLKKLVEENGIQCDWQTLSGVHAYMSEDMFRIGLAEVEALQRLDSNLASQITVVTKESRHPSLTDLRIPSAAGAFVQKNAASLWPYKLVAWIIEELLARNREDEALRFNLQTNTPVMRLQKNDDSWIVHTPRGMISAKQVLLTTNAYTSHLLPDFSDLIVPVQGEMSSLLPPRSLQQAQITRPLNHTYVFVGHGKQNINQDDYLVQRPCASKTFAIEGGELMFGGGRAEAIEAGVGVSDDSFIDPAAAIYLRRELSVVLDLDNHDRELHASYQWSGIMGFSRDNRPWVGELDDSVRVGGGNGLWISAGFTGHGMPNACLSAKAAVEMMLGSDKKDVDLPSMYHVSRERVEAARSLVEVHVADTLGLLS